jgi:acetyl esterase/lipase
MPSLNPELFDPEHISPETSEFNAGIDKLLSSLPPIYSLQPQTIREEREGGKGLLPVKRLDEVTDRKVPGPAGDISVRVFLPEKINGVFLHIHGGGFMLGKAYYQDEPLVLLANTCDLATVSVDYRLAPEDPYPAGPDDCEAAAVWLVENAKKEFGTENLTIGGESAGANLSAVTLLRLRDRHGYTGFRAANLFYGVYDLSMTPSARNWGEKPNLIITTKLMEWFHQNYAPAEHLSDPDISPLHADLADLPPALFSVGTLDPLLDDSLFMHARWIAAGNRAQLAVYPGGCHAFNAFPLEIAHQANSRALEFLASALN